jgi:hypothetical protein
MCESSYVSCSVMAYATVCRQTMTSKAFVLSIQTDPGCGELASAYLGSVRYAAGFTSCLVDTEIVIVRRMYFKVIRWYLCTTCTARQLLTHRAYLRGTWDVENCGVVPTRSCSLGWLHDTRWIWSALELFSLTRLRFTSTVRVVLSYTVLLVLTCYREGHGWRFRLTGRARRKTNSGVMHHQCVIALTREYSEISGVSWGIAPELLNMGSATCCHAV